jgi:hypothetical protein
MFSGKHEGIGIYKKVKNRIVEYNTVRDMRSFHIYVASSKYNIVRYNLVYESSGKAHGSFTETAFGISVGNE